MIKDLQSKLSDISSPEIISIIENAILKLHETNNVYENILLTLNEIIEHLNDF